MATTNPARGPRFHWDVRVPFSDTDRAGIVWWGNFLKYLELAEDEMYRAFGRPRNSIIGRGKIELPRTATTCTYRSPAWFDHVLDVTIGIESMSDRRVRWVFEIAQKASGRLVAEGVFETACMVADTLKGCADRRIRWGSRAEPRTGDSEARHQRQFALWVEPQRL